MGQQCWSLLILVALVTIESGYCFLFRRSEDPDSPDKVAHLKSRYWNDDIQPCIEKYCLPFVGQQRVYLQCLQHYCPDGLIAIPRDTDDASLASVTQVLGETDYCSTSFIDAIPEYDIDDILAGADPNGDEVATFKHGLYNLCRATLCSGEEGNAHRQCIAKRCCGRSGNEWELEPSTRKRASASKVATPLARMVRKKAFNDSLAQCMQSYCGNETNQRLRMRCNLYNCQRARN